MLNVVFQRVTSAAPVCLSVCCSSGSQLDSGQEHRCLAGAATKAGNLQNKSQFTSAFIDPWPLTFDPSMPPLQIVDTAPVRSTGPKRPTQASIGPTSSPSSSSASSSQCSSCSSATCPSSTQWREATLCQQRATWPTARERSRETSPSWVT